MLARLIDQRILQDPADAGRVRPQLRRDAVWHAAGELIQPLQHTGTGPINIRVVLEENIDIGIAEIRETANHRNLGRGEQRRDDRIGNLILDEIGRTSRPSGVDDDLCVGNIRQGVDRRLPHRPESGR